MAKAVWNGEIIAESKTTKKKEGHYYFPAKSIKKKFVRESPTHFVDFDKGIANYYDIIVNDKVYWNAAWYFPNPRKTAEDIKGKIAFGSDVEIVK